MTDTGRLSEAFFNDRYSIFRATAERIATFAEERSSPVPISETLEIVRLLSAVHDAQSRG